MVAETATLDVTSLAQAVTPQQAAFVAVGTGQVHRHLLADLVGARVQLWNFSQPTVVYGRQSAQLWELAVAVSRPPRWRVNGRHLKRLFVGVPRAPLVALVPAGARFISVMVDAALVGQRASGGIGGCLDPRAERSLRQLIGLAEHLVQTWWLSQDPVAVRSAAGYLLEGVLGALPAAGADVTSSLPPSPLLVAQALRLVDTLSADGGRVEPPAVHELAATLGVARRTLRHAFRRELGVGPSAYVRCQRLSRARGLLLSDAGPPSVTEVSVGTGFGDAGRFAHYYRQLFGELPSVTLQRRKQGYVAFRAPTFQGLGAAPPAAVAPLPGVTGSPLSAAPTPRSPHPAAGLPR